MSLDARVRSTLDGGEADRYRSLRSELDEADRFRPRYHFTPPGGQLHDPNGALYLDGEYHLFYQFWPPDLPRDRPWKDAMHWGHAVSDDLVHWHDLPIALAPDPGPERSCFSGQALVEDDRVVLMYYGPGAGNCIATSDDTLLVDWEKHPANPVIATEEYDHRVFDPEIWQAEDAYYAISGTYAGERFVDSHPAAYCYRSTDLESWTCLGPLLEDERLADPGEDAAVPNFFELDDRYVLLCFSHHRGPFYYVGEYDDAEKEFHPEHLGRLVHDPTTHQRNLGACDVGTLHAPSVLEDGDRRVAFLNVIEGRDGDEAGWSGVISLPRTLSLGPDGQLQQQPIHEIEKLRQGAYTIDERSLPSDEEILLAGAGGAQLEIDLLVDPGDAEAVTLRLLRSPDGERATNLTYYHRTDGLSLDTAWSATETAGHARQPETAPLSLDTSEPLRFRVFVDRSVVEVFANERTSLTGRVYPARESDGVSIRAKGGDAKLLDGDAYEMASASFNGR